ATDIAFAIAILALLGSSLPTALRTFLLTLASVDDLIAITIIAIFYTSDLQLWYLALALVPMAAFWWLANRREAWFKTRYWTAWALLGPLALITWVLFLNSGVHATIAGVVLAFLVALRGVSGRRDAWQPTVALGIIVGLVAGKILGIVGTSFAVTTFTSARLDSSLKWIDMIGMAAVAGIGFTVSLLVSELSFEIGDPMYDAAKSGVLT